MKNTSFKRVYGGQSGDTVEIHGKRRNGHWHLKILSVVLAFLFWLLISNVDALKSSQQDDQQPTQEAGVCDITVQI
ncbi:MAG: hypothetical protein E7625_01320 [Ruminococcaceae bacterium]|nr:hypothetical protein [Oscillospiraceae bacterium]